MNEPITLGPNEVVVRKVGSFLTCLFLVCYNNIILICSTSRQAAMAGKESDKMASWPRTRSSNNLRVALGSNKGQQIYVTRTLVLKSARNIMHASMA
jgi:hypothetical protein